MTSLRFIVVLVVAVVVGVINATPMPDPPLTCDLAACYGDLVANFPSVCVDNTATGFGDLSPTDLAACIADALAATVPLPDCNGCLDALTPPPPDSR
ncbi:hypothetical protein BU17DRAFT_89363 [Hysterangium stoloniferum]|nr:hypothetical protein BU17DRAFT_89363 [Hysterangium stoloniferum]